MKKIYAIILLFSFIASQAQVTNPGTWTEVGSLCSTIGNQTIDNNGRALGIAFVIEDSLYIGLGQNQANGPLSPSVKYADFWKITLSQSSGNLVSAVQLQNFPGGIRSGGVGFSIDNKGYVGLGGFSGPPYGRRDMWEYNPNAFVKWKLMDSIPGVARYAAVAFVMNGKAYVGSGLNANGQGVADFYEFNPTATSGNQWRQLDDMPCPGSTGRQYASGFSVGGKGYVGIGQDAAGTTTYSDFYQLDPDASSGNQWSQVPNFPQATFRGASFSLYNRWGFVARGGVPNGVSHTCTNDVNCYDKVVGSFTGNGVCASVPNPVGQERYLQMAASYQPSYRKAYGYIIGGQSGDNTTTYCQIYKYENAEMDTIVGIEDFKAIPTMSLFPNPTSNFLILNVSNSELEKSKFQIFDCTGRLMKEISNPESNKINVADLNTGLYFIHWLKEEEIVGVGKIVKE